VEATCRFADEVTLQQPHEARDFGRGSRPVVRCERVQRQHVDVAAGCGFDYLAHGLGARAVSRRARQTAPLRPTAVAVHDDRSMHESLKYLWLPGSALPCVLDAARTSACPLRSS